MLGKEQTSIKLLPRSQRKNRLIYKCEKCNSRSYRPLSQIKEKFPAIYSKFGDDIDKFMLLLRKGVYPYEYMDSWEKFNETKPPPKEKFYSNLSKQGITEKDYKHMQKVWDTFKIKNLGEYHDLYVRSDTSLLANVFENFRNICINTYQLDPAYFVSLPSLAWQACLKKTKVKLE